MPRISTSRDDAPAYLIRYENRRAAALAQPDPDADEPGFVARARARATDRALAELDQLGAPPGRTESFAFATTSPRELQLPESFRSRMAATTDVRLIRHGQTQGYISDGALTPLGRWQAHRKGQDLAKSIKEGSTVRLLHAATARAQETAVAVREGVLQALSRYGIGDVEVEEPQPAEAFDNFQVWCDGKEMDVTAGFQLYARILEEYERSGSGDRPGWIVEMDRFYKIETAGGDPITQWLHQPMHYFEPPINVVRRHWAGIVDQLRDAPPNLRLYVCGHSGPLRALASAAVGHDPGEPYNVEDVRIRVFPDLEHAIVTYRGRGVEIEIPTTVTPSWHR
jgi:broad specificity phosphatase PhoE